MTLFDHGVLVANFGLTEQDPGFNPEADLDGDGEVTLFDFGILVNHFGEIGVDALTGVEQPMEEGLTIPLRLQLGDWGGHPSRVINVEFRAKAVGTESNPDAPVYVKTVSIVAPSAEVDVELTLPAGAYTVQAKASHWLRGEGVVLTSAPWIFAAPTGADKVTVYWDPVPNATGYRVRWGTASGVYPNVSSVQPADARMLSVTGLSTEQEYYFVVEAERNGVWSAPSEEDSAVPHVGAIPWDSGDAFSILAALRSWIGDVPPGELFALSPDGTYYDEDEEGIPRASPAPGYYDETTGMVHYTDGAVIPLAKSQEDALGNEQSGPYRRVRTSAAANAKGARGVFFLPPPVFFNIPYIWIGEGERNGGHWDTPCIYFGVNSTTTDGKRVDIEGGIMFHPSGRQGVNYHRWMPFLVSKVGKAGRKNHPILGSMGQTKNHIRYEGSAGVGLLTILALGQPDGGKSKLVTLFVLVLDAGDYRLRFRNVFVGTSLPITGIAKVRRVVSIGQKLLNETELRTGYAATNSFVINIGVGCVDANLLIAPTQVWRNNSWEDWTDQLTEQAGVFPAQPRVVTVQQIAPYTYEIVSIDF